MNSGEIVGDLCFKGIDINGMVEIGYGTNEAYRNKGYMTEAVMAMTKWASEQDGVTRIEAEAEESNTASKKVLSKCGYEKNGVLGEKGPRYTWRGNKI